MCGERSFQARAAQTAKLRSPMARFVFGTTKRVVSMEDRKARAGTYTENCSARYRYRTI